MGFVERIMNYDAARDTTIRNGFKNLFTEATYRLLPTVGLYQPAYHPTTANFYVLNPDNTFNELSHELRYDMVFKNTAGIQLTGEMDDVKLLYPVSFTDGKPLPAAKYHYALWGATYSSDIRKLFTYVPQCIKSGSFYNGSFRQATALISLRKQPRYNIGLQAEYNKLEFPAPHGNTELFLVAPRVEINFATNLFWTTFVQYNTQANNFNINSRFQWRYKPMSDIFLVYTDNYFSTPFLHNKNRALVFKMNYWLNL